MRIVRNRPEARWLPSRFTFAIFRLIALLRFRSNAAQREEPRELILAIDPGQSAVENYLVAGWVSLTVASYAAAWLRHLVPLAIAFLAGILLSAWLLQLPLYAVGLLLPHSRNNQRVISTATFAVMIAVSAWVVTLDGRIRFVAALFLVVVALNALIALVMAPLRGTVRRMEQACGL